MNSPYKIKIVNSYAKNVDEIFNKWLEDNPSIKILYVVQSESMSIGDYSLTLTVFYKETK